MEKLSTKKKSQRKKKTLMASIDCLLIWGLNVTHLLTNFVRFTLIVKTHIETDLML